jgi:hypothetical protein
VNTRHRGGLRLLALVPHRDIRKKLRSWSGTLFAAGLAGAWSFPWVVPLACLSRPLTAGELRDAAFALRGESAGGDGKFRTGAPALSPFPAFLFSRSGGALNEPDGRGSPAVYGPRLEPGNFEEALKNSGAAKALYWFFPPVLGAAVIDSAGPEAAMAADRFPDPPLLAFRAAALVNMVFRPLNTGDRAYSFAWKTGRPRWLPPVKPRGAPG